MLNSKFIIANDKIIELVQISGTLRWVTNDEYRTEFFFENDASADPVTRCGVGFFSLSPNSPLTPACSYHDKKFNSETYQAFHTMDEANRELRRDITLLNPSQHWIGELFYKITSWFGGRFWENKETK